MSNNILHTKKNKSVRLYGAGGHSEVVKEILLDEGYEISKIFDDNVSNCNEGGKNIIPGIFLNLNNFPHRGDPIIIAIGKNCKRKEISEILNSSFQTVIHRSAIISKNTKIEEGTVIMAGAIVQTNSFIGKHTIINTGATVDHDCFISDFTHISPNATICGNVKIGTETMIGAGAVVIQNITIGKKCVIGAGSIIICDVPDGATVVGNPGKIIKINKEQ